MFSCLALVSVIVTLRRPRIMEESSSECMEFYTCTYVSYLALIERGSFQLYSTVRVQWLLRSYAANEAKAGVQAL